MNLNFINIMTLLAAIVTITVASKDAIKHLKSPNRDIRLIRDIGITGSPSFEGKRRTPH